MPREFEDIYIAYSRFNASRSLGVEADSDFRVERRGGSVALIDEARPSPSFSNRILGLATGDTESLSDLLSLYRNGLPQIDLRPDEEIAPIERFGYRQVETLTYLKATPRAISKSDICVERWGAERADEFVGLLNRTMETPVSPSIWDRRRKHYCTDSFRTFVAYLDSVPYAWATLFVHDGAGILANAFTFENARRKGCHSALLRHRINDAVELGIGTLFTDVIPETESRKNCLSAGFEEVATDTLWHPNKA